MNITIHQFNDLMARVASAVHNEDRVQTIRLSLLFAHNSEGQKVDLARLTSFGDADFWHDVYGIDAHASRSAENAGELMDGFEPRCGFVSNTGVSNR